MRCLEICARTVFYRGVWHVTWFGLGQMQRLDAWESCIVGVMVVSGYMRWYRGQMQRLGLVLGVCRRRGTLEWAFLLHGELAGRGQRSVRVVMRATSGTPRTLGARSTTGRRFGNAIR